MIAHTLVLTKAFLDRQCQNCILQGQSDTSDSSWFFYLLSIGASKAEGRGDGTGPPMLCLVHLNICQKILLLALKLYFLKRLFQNSLATERGWEDIHSHILACCMRKQLREQETNFLKCSHPSQSLGLILLLCGPLLHIFNLDHLEPQQFLGTPSGCGWGCDCRWF